MPINPLVLELLVEITESGRTAEEVCKDRPELLGEVRACLRQLDSVRNELDALFPEDDGDVSALSTRPQSMPEMPGYDVGELLGRGGMGVVYKARHLGLNRPVAVKMMLNGGFARPAELTRFQREAEALAALEHPNIVRVYDVGESGGLPYFTMEFIDGGSLAQKLADTAQPVRETAKLLAVLARAVQSAHRGGIVHRDLKPANILLTDDGIPKISDFGLARRVDADDGLTLSGAIIGTPNYMAPEQFAGALASSGPAVDIYALGAMLYEMLTGAPPFRRKSAPELQGRLVSDEALPPSKANAKVPGDLDTICLKCLQKDPLGRYDSAGALADDLERFLRHEPIHARPIGRIERCGRWARRSPTAVALLVSLLVLCGVLIAQGISAVERRAEKVRITARWESAVQLVKQGRFSDARTILGRLPDGGFEDLRGRIDRSISDLNLIEELDAVGLNRVSISDGSYDMRHNKARSDLTYQSIFSRIGMGNINDNPRIIAQQLSTSVIKNALVAAFDDWSVCVTDAKKRDWILEVARYADPDPTGWRDHVRDPTTWSDRVVLSMLTESAPGAELSVQLLRALGDRIDDAGLDSIPFRIKVQRLHANDFLANFSLADALREKNPAESIRYYQSALAIRPRAAAVYNSLGMVLFAVGRKDEAIEEYQQALRIDPKFMLAHNNIGLTLAGMGKLNGAISELQEAIEIDPKFAYAHYNIGLNLRIGGRPEEAIEHLRKAIAINPTYVHTHFNLGLALRDQGRLEDSIGHFRATLNLDPKYAVARRFLGLTLAETGNTKEAIENFQHALKIDPSDVYSRNDLGRALAETGRLDEAVENYQQALKTDPKFATVWNNCGIALRMLGRFDEAIDHFNEALKIGPGDTYALYQLGVTLVSAGKREEAIGCFRHTIEIDDKYAEVYRALGEALLNNRQPAEAAAAFRKCLDLLPQSDPQRDAISKLLQQCGGSTADSSK